MIVVSFRIRFIKARLRQFLRRRHMGSRLAGSGHAQDEEAAHSHTTYRHSPSSHTHYHDQDQGSVQLKT